MSRSRDTSKNAHLPQLTIGNVPADYPKDVQGYTRKLASINEAAGSTGRLLVNAGGSPALWISFPPGSTGDVLAVDTTQTYNLAWRPPRSAWQLWDNITTTSGTEAVFTDLPTWATEIRIDLAGVSCSTAERPILTLGYGTGSPITYMSSGYAGNIDQEASAVLSHSTFFYLHRTADAAETVWGPIYLHNYDANTWFLEGGMLWDGSTSSINGNHGHVTVGGTLSSLKFAFESGGSFDAGAIKVWYM